MKQLEISGKQNVQYCIPLELRDEQIKINLTKVKGRLEPNPELIEEPIAVVCFAPSLNETWEKIKDFKYVMTCSGAHKFLVERGIIPTYHIDLDPRIHKLKLLGTPQKETKYLIASTIHPKYLDTLKGFDVNLWHIFANEEDGARVLPRGEWSITGGSSVGLRCFTLARFLGFNNIHVFGMDGSFTEKGTHTAEHPNAPTEKYETEYNGKKFLTTPSMLHVAQETFHELDQMPDCTFNFYGDGLVQEMAKKYKPASRSKAMIAFNKPELISKEYKDLNYKLHQDNPSYGMGGSKYKDTVIKLSESLSTTSILDYGCGKGLLAKSLPFPIWEYDPAIPDKSAPPKPADIVICTDVLEHIEPDKLQYVLDDIRFCTKKVAYLVISTRLAAKKYANDQNAHLIVKGKEWWEKQLKKFFDIGSIIEKDTEKELHIVVGPKVAVQPDMKTVEKDGLSFKFLTPNETTKWRAQTLFTKEPSTIEWIDGMKAGEVMYDVGANVGSYSVYAGVKGMKVYSFEPEAGNYGVLVKNMTLNNIPPNAYCIALSDEEKAGTLYAGQADVGGACHSFNEPVGHDLKVRETPFTQGCFGIPLDTLVANGLPSPQHIKVDVDGFEYKVIKGAEKTLMNGVQSILIEINPELVQHKEMIEFLQGIGFSYDKAQVERARRKDGTFKGVAEYIFTKKPLNDYITDEMTKQMDSGEYSNSPFLWKSEAQRIDKIKEIAKTKEEEEFYIENGPVTMISAYPIFVPKSPNVPAMSVAMAKVGKVPFSHLYIKEFFTKEDFREMIANMPDNYVEIEKSRGTKGYPERFTAIPKGEIWDKVIGKLTDGRLKKALLEKFGIEDKGFAEDVLLVRDLPGYKIPPHTDSTSKIITVLIYLPQDESFVGEGTSMFVPKKKGFTCKDGRHYKFEDFKKVKTMPFKPNSAFIFARTDNSFHGVEPCEHVRDVLLYNIKVK